MRRVTFPIIGNVLKLNTTRRPQTFKCTFININNLDIDKNENAMLIFTLDLKTQREDISWDRSSVKNLTNEKTYSIEMSISG